VPYWLGQTFVAARRTSAVRNVSASIVTLLLADGAELADVIALLF
jgi:hypothetical protein